jgi:hypothetical protein
MDQKLDICLNTSGPELGTETWDSTDSLSRIKLRYGRFAAGCHWTRHSDNLGLSTNGSPPAATAICPANNTQSQHFFLSTTHFSSIYYSTATLLSHLLPTLSPSINFNPRPQSSFRTPPGLPYPYLSPVRHISPLPPNCHTFSCFSCRLLVHLPLIGLAHNSSAIILLATSSLLPPPTIITRSNPTSASYEGNLNPHRCLLC